VRVVIYRVLCIDRVRKAVVCFCEFKYILNQVVRLVDKSKWKVLDAGGVDVEDAPEGDIDIGGDDNHSDDKEQVDDINSCMFKTTFTLTSHYTHLAKKYIHCVQTHTVINSINVIR